MAEQTGTNANKLLLVRDMDTDDFDVSNSETARLKNPPEFLTCVDDSIQVNRADGTAFQIVADRKRTTAAFVVDTLDSSSSPGDVIHSTNPSLTITTPECGANVDIMVALSYALKGLTTNAEVVITRTVLSTDGGATFQVFQVSNGADSKGGTNNSENYFENSSQIFLQGTHTIVAEVRVESLNLLPGASLSSPSLSHLTVEMPQVRCCEV